MVRPSVLVWRWLRYTLTSNGNPVSSPSAGWGSKYVWSWVGVMSTGRPPRLSRSRISTLFSFPTITSFLKEPDAIAFCKNFSTNFYNVIKKLHKGNSMKQTPWQINFSCLHASIKRAMSACICMECLFTL